MTESPSPAVSAPASGAAPAAPAEPPISDLYKQATRVNAKLATATDKAVFTEAKALADQILAYVKSKVGNLDDFASRVHVSEDFSLNEAKQLAKAERDLKIYFLRARGLLDGIAEAEIRIQRHTAGR